MSDRIAVVTGGSTGIGAAIVARLRSIGYRAVVADLRPPMDADAPFYEVDVRNRDAVERMVAAVVADHGHIDAVCANAGVSTMGRVWELGEDEWDSNMDVNAKGVFLTIQAALRHMLPRREGTIVVTASMAGLRGVPLLAHYAASKWAVIGLVKSAAIEAAPYGIRINAVCPGYVRTPMQEREVVWEAQLRGMTPEEVRQEYVTLTPLGRIEEPEDVADAVALLLSPEAAFLTGVALPVTGGADLL